ncbi:MAG TPA: hypothetical protein VF663_10405 [Telluria sp.]|jgi:CheY-like chemotaxis protein
MKSTVRNTACLSGNRQINRSGKRVHAERAHTPARRTTSPARQEADIAPQGLDHLAYLEQDNPYSWQASVPHADVPRVLHVDTETGTAAVLASLLGAEAHVTHVATMAAARQLLQQQIFSLVILDPALPDGDAKLLLPLLADTPLLVYSDQQPAWREVMAAPFLSKSWTTARQLWTRMSTMLWDTSAMSAGD